MGLDTRPPQVPQRRGAGNAVYLGALGCSGGLDVAMAVSVEQLEAEALQLPASERARLAERLIASLDQEADHEQVWAAEVQRRLADLQAGRVQTIPAADVISAARARLR